MKTLAIIFAVFYCFTITHAQSKTSAGLTDDEITQLSSNLAMKLLLNDSQTNAVTELLKNYRSNLGKVMGSSVAESQNKIISATNEQIISLLDSKQKMKYNVVGPDWWKSVQEAYSN